MENLLRRLRRSNDVAASGAGDGDFLAILFWH